MHLVAVDPRLARVNHVGVLGCEQAGHYRTLIEARTAAYRFTVTAQWLAGRIAIAECAQRTGGYHLLIGSERARFARGEQLSLSTKG